MISPSMSSYVHSLRGHKLLIQVFQMKPTAGRSIGREHGIHGRVPALPTVKRSQQEDTQAGPRQLELPHPLLSLECAPLAFLTLRSCSEGTGLRWKCGVEAGPSIHHIRVSTDFVLGLLLSKVQSRKFP